MTLTSLSRTGYLPFVDGLRALAIATVVAFHAYPSVVSGGYVGVDVFFVISGFLITRLIASDMAAGQFSFGRFLVRRARRLLPAAMLCLASVTVLGGLVLYPDAYHYLGRSLLASALMYANFFFYNTAGYFSAPALEKPLLHMWSLAVEDQFYLTWPLLLLALTRYAGRTTIAATVAALMAASLFIAQRKLAIDPDFSFYLLPSRAWELLAGCALALVAHRVPRWPIAGDVAVVGGVTAIVASAFLFSSQTPFPGLAALPTCLGTVAIIAGGLSGSRLVGALFEAKPVVGFGLISYSLYLWHWPLLSLLAYRLERAPSAIEATAAVAVAFVFAILSWRFVEQPFRAKRDDAADAMSGMSTARFIAASLAIVAVVCGAAVVLKVTRGLPQRYEDRVRTALDQMVSGNPWRRSCDNYDQVFANDDVCNFGRRRAAGESYDVAVFGDSMADHWVPLAAKLAEQRQWSGRQVTNGGCGMFVGVDAPAESAAKRRECGLYQDAALAFIEKNPGLKLAIVSASWEKWAERLAPEQTSTQQDGTAPERALYAALASTMQHFTQRGIQVLLLGQPPVFEDLPVRCIMEAVARGDMTSGCGLLAKDIDAQLRRSRQVLQRLVDENPLVYVSHPADVLCSQSRCQTLLDGVLVYRDKMHLSQAGALAFFPYVSFPKPVKSAVEGGPVRE